MIPALHRKRHTRRSFIRSFCVCLDGVPGGGESEGAKRRNSVTKMLASKVKRQPEGSTAEQWALKNARDSPENKTKQPQKRLFFVNDEQKGASF